jgi:hypothetical protein
VIDDESNPWTIKAYEAGKRSVPSFIKFQDGALVITPTISSVGIYFIRIKITDALNASSSYQFMLTVNEVPKMLFNEVAFKIKQISPIGIMTIAFSGKTNGTRELIAKITNSTFEIILHQGTDSEKIKFELIT